MRGLKYLLAALLTIQSTFAFGKSQQNIVDSATVARNGGDILLTRLLAARSIMGQSIQGLLKEDPKTSRYGCINDTDSLDRICHDFLLAIAPQIGRLIDPYTIPLLLSQAPLSVKDPFTGLDNFVSARTSLGHRGPIEFYSGSLKDMDMPQIVFLLTHEFMHKVQFKEEFVTDEKWFHPKITGRSLIDFLAANVMNYALDHGYLGRVSATQYSFSCSIKSPYSHMGADFKINRTDYQGSSTEDFRLVLGEETTDPHFYFYPNDESRIEFIFSIDNRGFDSCNQKTGIKGVRMKLVKSMKRSDGVYISRLIKASNIFASPLCPSESPTFGMSYEDKTFTCTYIASTTR